MCSHKCKHRPSQQLQSGWHERLSLERLDDLCNTNADNNGCVDKSVQGDLDCQGVWRTCRRSMMYEETGRPGAYLDRLPMILDT